MKKFDRFSFPRNYSGKLPLFFRKFPEKFRRNFPEISELTTLPVITWLERVYGWLNCIPLPCMHMSGKISSWNTVQNCISLLVIYNACTELKVNCYQIVILNLLYLQKGGSIKNCLVYGSLHYYKQNNYSNQSYSTVPHLRSVAIKIDCMVFPLRKKRSIRYTPERSPGIGSNQWTLT